MTRKRFEGDPIAALRGVDPLPSLDAPGDTTGAHARALFAEVTSMDVMDDKAAPQPKQPLMRKVALGVGMAVAAAAIAGGAYALLKDKADEPIVGGEPLGDAMAMCIQYTDQMLLDQEYAFDGTLVAVDGNNAIFDVHNWYKGGEGAQITLKAEGLVRSEAVALVGTSLEVGQRYLISGTDGFVWACGFSVTYDTEIANHWSELFGA